MSPTEAGLQPRQLFNLLGQKPRTFHHVVGLGGSYVLRTNSFELLGPRSTLVDAGLNLLFQFAQEEYEMPLSYQLIMEAMNCLQKLREYRLAVVHAETGFEVYVVDRLVKLMIESGMSHADASAKVEGDRQYWGVKRKIRGLDDLTKTHCIKNGTTFVPFWGSPLASRWESDLYSKRNAAVHSGVRNFSYDEASAAIAIAKECIVALESRVPSMADRVQLTPSMAGFHQNAGEVAF